MRIRLHPALSSSLTVLAAATLVACEPAPEPDAADTTATTAPVAEEAGIREAMAAFGAAWTNEDLEAAMAAFTDDAVAFDPIPPGRFTGTEGIREWIGGGFEALDSIRITMEPLTVKTNGAVGWVDSPYVVEALWGGEPYRDEGELSMIWVRQADGSYRSPLFHASPPPPPMPGEEGEAGGAGSP